MAHAFKQESSEKVAKMFSRIWMYTVLDWIGRRIWCALQVWTTFVKNLGADMLAELIQKVVEVCKEMEECKAVLSQQVWERTVMSHLIV